MSHKQPKKKRPSPMFSMEAVEARINSKTTLLHDIRQHIQALKEVDLKILVKTHFSELGEDEAIHLLTSKMSMQGLIYLKLAAKHVPKNITRHVNGVSLRISLICKIFNEVTSCEMPKLSIQEVDLYLSFADKYCPNYLSSEESMEELWSVSEPEELFSTRFLTPPVATCLRCDKSLAMHNNPSKAKIFTLDGPIPCTKVKLECKECAIQYGVAKFTDDLGSHFYSSEFDIDFVEVTNVTYVDLRLYRWMPSLSNHCWVSFSGFSEAYNDVYQNEIIKYCNMTGSFKVDSEETGDETNVKAGASGGELSAKTVAKCFWLREVEEELQSNGLHEKWVFATKKDGEFSGTNDDAMEALDRKRCDELYSHKCSDHCKQKGCGCLYVADGNWKLRYAHCMWKVPIKLAGFGDINYPCICPISPKRGYAFCEEHCEKAELLGYPTELRKFLKRCGISDGGVTEVLDEVSSKALLTEFTDD